jgi:adenylate cyclase
MERRLAAILAADVVGYSRLMGDDEAGTLATLKVRRKEVLEPLVTKHRGRIFKLMGDGALVEFGSAVNAVECAVALQRGMVNANVGLSEQKRVELRIGINLGEVMAEGGDLYGDGVNLAARLETLAKPGDICISGKVRDEVARRLDLALEDLGERTLKNIAAPVHVYRVQMKVPSPAGGLEPLHFSAERSLVVLPFRNLSGDPKQDHFADGMTEELITTLSRFPELFVIDRHSAFTYKDKVAKAQDVGHELGVRHVLAGSFRKIGKRARITAQLINAQTGRNVWAERYERELRDIFAVEDEIAGEIMTALQVELTEGAQARRWRHGTTNLKAWEHAARGISRLRQWTTKESGEARAMLAKAVEIDPRYAVAWAWLGRTHAWELLEGLADSPEQSLRRGLECAEMALALDPLDSDAYTLMCALHLYRHQYDEAVAAGEKAVALDPNGAENYRWLAMCLVYAGRPREAVAAIRKSMRLAPIPVADSFHWLAKSHLAIGELDSALSAALEAVSRAPQFAWHHLTLAWVYIECRRIDEGRASLADALATDPKLTVSGCAKLEHYSDRSMIDRFVNALRKAGLPE